MKPRKYDIVRQNKVVRSINDNVDTLKSENELMAFKNIFNDWYARDTSKKIKAVFKAKGQSGKPLATIPPYAYMKSETNKNLWVIDEQAAEVVREIFHLCISGYGPNQIARILTNEGVPKKTLRQAEKRIEELDRLFKRLYEDNVSGKISDERFETLSNGYEDEQKALKAAIAELSAKIETAEQKTSDVSAFVKLVKKYESFTELTPEIMHELIDKIVVHAPDKSSGHRTQEVEIHFRFKAATAIAMADSMVYGKKRKAA